MLTQLSRLALTDGTNTVNLINISEGVDGAERFGYSVEDTELIIDGGDTKFLTLEHTLEIRTLWDSSHKAQLSTWEQAKTPLQLSGYGVDGFVYWHDPVTVSYADTPAGSSQVFWIKATRTTPPGYTDTFRKTGGIQVSKNLLAIYDRERGTSELMAGTGLSGDVASYVPRVFTDGEQTLELAITPTIASFFTFRPSSTGPLGFIIPFVGQQITFSVNVSAISGTGTWKMVINFRDAADSFLSSSELTLTTTGISTLTATIPTGAHSARIQISQAVTGGAQDGDSITFSRPALNIGSTRKYSRF